MSSSVFPSGENSKPRTPSLCLVTCQGSPPSAYMNHTCGFASFSSPVDRMNAIIRPSGDHSGSDTLRSPRVNGLAAVSGPPAGTIQRLVTDFPCSPFFISTLATRYATRDPSGERRGENTRATRSASLLLKRRRPVRLRAATESRPASCACSFTVPATLHASMAAAMQLLTARCVIASSSLSCHERNGERRGVVPLRNGKMRLQPRGRQTNTRYRRGRERWCRRARRFLWRGSSATFAHIHVEPSLASHLTISRHVQSKCYLA